MRSAEIILDNNAEESMMKALAETDNFIEQNGLTGKNAIHLRLLAEETVSMVRAMTHDIHALFWIEKDPEKGYMIRLMAKTEMDINKKKDLLSVSTSGKNAWAKGFMGKIGDIFENGILNYCEVINLQQEYVGGSINYGNMGVGLSDDMPVEVSSVVDEQVMWSLHDYKQSLAEMKEKSDPASEAWDELEKSVVANIAKDVIVGVKKDKVDMTIISGIM
ncbi:MAG: hypothetical protein IKN45_09960 [Lachnospiraceae bacterium]|nr:hypothetical protein [Lachnospiraceae bacterium]